LRSRHEREQIVKQYPKLYNKSAEDAIKGDTSGWYTETLLSLLRPTGEALAVACHRAMAGLGTDEAALIRILGYHTKNELRELQASYEKLYGKPLADAVASETSGWFAQGLAYILTQAQLDKSLEEAVSGDTSFDYKNLLLALIEDQGTRDARYVNDSKLIAMLVLRSRYEREQIVKEYPKLYNKSAEDAIKGDTMGWYTSS